MLHADLTEKIIGCAYTVYNRMGFGYLESVYEKCLMIELHKAELQVQAQVAIPVYYEGELVGDFRADILVEETVLVELKSIKALAATQEAQLVNYLVATEKEVGLLINFGETRVEIKRKTRRPGQDFREEGKGMEST
jgi:GxxExxY protein